MEFVAKRSVEEAPMSDTYRRYRAIRLAFLQLYTRARVAIRPSTSKPSCA